MSNLISFLQKLEEHRIYYKLNRIRDSLLVEIAVSGQRWEVEFFENGDIVIEKFLSDGNIYGSNEIEELFRQFSD